LPLLKTLRLTENIDSDVVLAIAIKLHADSYGQKVTADKSSSAPIEYFFI